MNEIGVHIRSDGVIVYTPRFSENVSLALALAVGAITLVLAAGLTMGITVVIARMVQREFVSVFNDFVLWCGVVGSAVVTVLAGGFTYSRCRYRKVRLAEGMCVVCGYDLSGNASGRCPECGVEAFPYEEARRQYEEKRRQLKEQGVQVWTYRAEGVDVE